MRFYEILPGFLSWFTLLVLTFLSWQKPSLVSLFIIVYDFYWIWKLAYLFFHLRFSFKKMYQNLAVDWLEMLQKSNLPWKNIYHLVIFPFFQEPEEVIKESLRALANVRYPKENILVVLASEERGGIEDERKAEKVREIFQHEFGALMVTKHPQNIKGEIPGKGANVAYAAKKALSLIDQLKIPYENVLVSTFDIDTKVEKDYFGVLTYTFLNTPKRLQASYQPIPLFMNNFNSTHFFVRLISFSATFWQLMQSARARKMVTFSSHSIPLTALFNVGFWEKNVVSEDSRIFFQCLNYYNGDFRTVPLFYPVYMDAVWGKNFWQAVKNLYKQQRRWAWGVENFVYLVRDFKRNKNMPFLKKAFWLVTVFNGFYSWATSSFIIFTFGFLPNIIGKEEFRESVLSYNLPRYTGLILNFSTIGIVISAFLALFIISHRVKDIPRWRYLYYFLEWLLMPIVFIIFGAVPALEAQTRLMLGGKYRLGFFKTPKGELNTNSSN